MRARPFCAWIPNVDNQAVAKAVKVRVWPRLRELGFNRTLGRSAYRDGENVVDVVNVGGLPSSTFFGVGATSHSFAVNLGVRFLDLPVGRPTRVTKAGVPAPHEYECELRRSLPKGLVQPLFKPYGHADRLQDRLDVWFVLEDGSNLDACLDDAIEQIRTEGESWFTMVHDPASLVERLDDQIRVHEARRAGPNGELPPTPLETRGGVRLMRMNTAYTSVSGWREELFAALQEIWVGRVDEAVGRINKFETVVRENATERHHAQSIAFLRGLEEGPDTTST